MSVHVRLNNRSFFGGNSVIIGSRLNEANEQQPANQQQPTQNTSNNQQPQTNTNNQPNQPTLDQQVNGIIMNGFSNMVQAISTEFQKIQLPQGLQWVAPGQMQEQSVNGAVQMAQTFLKANIEVAKKALGSQNQQQQNQSQQAAQQAQVTPVNNQQPAQQ